MFGINIRRKKYPITAAQNEERMAKSVSKLAYLVVAILVLITGAHAVMLVLSEAAEFTLAGQSGLVLMLFTILRVGFPLVVELAAVISVTGAIKGLWRGDQKSWAGYIDAVWLIFAAANMITFFAVERGQPLQSWQVAWLQYGLPLSGIIAGVMITRLLLADPDHQRAEEQNAAAEEREANEFNAKVEVEASEPMMLIQRRRAWRDYINGLAAKGYSQDEIDFIVGYLPELQNMPTVTKAAAATSAQPSLFTRARDKLLGGGDNMPEVVPLMTQSEAGQNTQTATQPAQQTPGQGERRQDNGTTKPIGAPENFQ